MREGTTMPHKEYFIKGMTILLRSAVPLMVIEAPLGIFPSSSEANPVRRLNLELR